MCDGPYCHCIWIADSLDRQQLSENDALELVRRLVDHYVFLVNGGEQAFVVRKLASSLATIFLKPNTPWNRALWNLAASLPNGKHLTEEQSQTLDLGNAILPAMSENHIVALLYFSNTLAEEINKWSPETRRSGESERVIDNVKDALCLVEFVLRHVLQRGGSGDSGLNVTPAIEAIQSYLVSASLTCHFLSHNAIFIPIVDFKITVVAVCPRCEPAA